MHTSFGDHQHQLEQQQEQEHVLADPMGRCISLGASMSHQADGQDSGQQGRGDIPLL
jgi:hypothetical protein